MFLDIGVGILLAILFSWFFDFPLTLVWTMLGILFSVLPDLDGIVNIMRHRGLGGVYRHRELLHVPLVYIPIGTSVFVCISPILALLFAAASLIHFMHDSVALGWGVQWLRPFSADHFSFLYLYNPPGRPALPRRFFYRFKDADIPRLDATYGDPNFIKNVYLRFHPIAIVELVFLIASLGVWFWYVH